MTDDIFDGMDIDANPNSIKGEAAPTAEELISQFQGNDLHELTTPPKLQHQSPKDSLSGTPRKNQQHDWHDSGQNTPIRPLSFGGQNIGNISSGITGNAQNNAGNGQYLKQENMQNRNSINPTIQNLNNSNNTSLNSSIAPSNISGVSTSNISNWAHGGWDSGIASAQQTTGHNSVASRSVAGSAMPKQWGNNMNNQSNNQSYAQSEMSVQSRFSLPSIASTSAIHNNRESLNRADDNGSCLSWTGSDAPSGAPSRSGSRYPPMVPSNFPPQLMSTTNNPELNAEEAAGIIPTLINYLTDNDPTVFEAATQIVHRLTKNQQKAGLQSVINNDQLVQLLINLVGPKIEKRPASQKTIAAILHSISQDRQGLLKIIQHNGIQALMILLTSNNDGTQSFSVTALHNILSFANTPEGKKLRRQYDIKQMVRKAGGNERLSCLLKNTNNKFLAICTDSLGILAYGSPDSKVRILQSRAPEDLVRIMAHSSYPKLLHTTSKLWRILSTCKHSKPEIVRLGGMQALGRHLANQQQAKLMQTCLLTIRNLSDAATKIKNMEAILNLLVECLKSGDESIVECAAGTLMNLTCNNMQNKITVHGYKDHNGNKGIEVLATLAIKSKSVKILEPVLCCLRNITSRHLEAYNACLSLRNYHGLGSIVELLNLNGSDGSPIHWKVAKPVIGVLRNMAQYASQECQPALRGVGTIPKLMNMISFAKKYMHKENARTSEWSNDPTNRVRPEDICIAACNSLNWLAKDDHNRQALISLRAIPTLCELLRHRVPMDQKDLSAQQKFWGKDVKFESKLAEDVCGAAAHVLLSVRVAPQARQILDNYKVTETLNQFQSWLDQTNNGEHGNMTKQLMEQQKAKEQPRVPPQHPGSSGAQQRSQVNPQQNVPHQNSQQNQSQNSYQNPHQNSAQDRPSSRSGSSGNPPQQNSAQYPPQNMNNRHSYHGGPVSSGQPQTNHPSAQQPPNIPPGHPSHSTNPPRHPQAAGFQQHPQAYSSAPGYYPNNPNNAQQPRQQVPSSQQPGQMYPSNYPYSSGGQQQHQQQQQQPPPGHHQQPPNQPSNSRQTTGGYFPPTNNYFGQ